MDQIKIGKFIAELRKEKCMTQEQLGEKLGVTNKTISRWENGNYMPDVEMLSLLSKELNVTINELIIGERLETEEFKKAMEYMDTFVISDPSIKIPVDEDGKGAVARMKYGL